MPVAAVGAWYHDFPEGDVGVIAGVFRHLALAVPEAVERAHLDRPDFRVRGKILASLGS